MRITAVRGLVAVIHCCWPWEGESRVAARGGFDGQLPWHRAEGARGGLGMGTPPTGGGLRMDPPPIFRPWLWEVGSVPAAIPGLGSRPVLGAGGGGEGGAEQRFPLSSPPLLPFHFRLFIFFSFPPPPLLSLSPIDWSCH